MNVEGDTAGLSRDRAEAFAAWAGTYDEQPNPLLSLEGRYLRRFIAPVEGKNVLDIGCGTGRWLAYLSEKHPLSLRGVDASAEMLQKAADKKIPGASLSVASCTALPLADASVDVVIASFLLSYVEDLPLLVSELARVTRDGGDVFLTDMHPATAAKLGWRRSFRKDTASSTNGEIEASSLSIDELLASVHAAGFALAARVEPEFGPAEAEIFRANHRRANLEAAAGLPAVYILHLRKGRGMRMAAVSQERPAPALSVKGARCALGACESVYAEIYIEHGEVSRVDSGSLVNSSDPEECTQLDLSGYLVMPGLVNAHDHLEFALYPNLGRGPYGNAAEWAKDIHKRDAKTIALHQEIVKPDRLLWGGLRNLLCGVTTVCHHNPPAATSQDDGFPVRVVSRYGWVHSLYLSSDAQAVFADSPVTQPFILHACEGTDSASANELDKLRELGMLAPRTVLVHGLALDESGARAINERGASLIICPTSNQFLFDRVPAPEVLRTIAKLALGSDSPLTAAGDLLDEIRFAIQVCELPLERLYGMVTEDSAAILKLAHGEGTMRPGARADLIAVRDSQMSPAETLSRLAVEDVELVLLAGRVQLASDELYAQLSEADKAALEPLEIEGRVRWLRAPVETLLSNAEAVLGKSKVRLGGMRVERVERAETTLASHSAPALLKPEAHSFIADSHGPAAH